MGFVKEFKEFAFKGNVMDMAIGIIIGGAFGKIVSSLVNDIIMPPIGRLLGGTDFSSLFINLGAEKFETLAEATEAGAATINYGMFINNVVDFIIIALAIFMVIKQMNRLKKKEEPAPVAVSTTKECPHCITQIPIKATRCPNCTSQLT